jgi:hypothetical protein
MTFTKYLLTFSCFLSIQYAQGQFSPTTTDSSNQFAITGNAGIYSNGLPLELSNKFLYGGMIDVSIKDNAVNKLKGKNYLAAEMVSKLSYLSKNKTIFGVKNAFWGIEIGTQVLSYNKYSDDLFKLVFYGNEPYTDESLNLAQSSSKTIWYHNIGLTAGINLNNIGRFDNLQIRAIPSFVIGILQRDFNLNTGDFLTETNGEYIELNFAGNYTASDSLYNAFSSKGNGGKIDISLLLESKKNKIGLTISDLGAIAFKNKLNYNLDTAFTFSGIEIEDIFDVQDTLLTVAEIQDSTFKNKSNKTTVSLPMLVSVYYEHTFSDKWVLKNWLKYRLVDNYIPFIMSQINYKTAGFTGGLTAAYGGYTGFQAGINAGYDFNIANITLGTTNILGFIDQKNQYSQNLYGRITFHF